MVLCTLQYLGDILRKTKKAFQLFEVVPVNIESKYKKVLTIERVIAMISEDTFNLQFLPDEPDTHVTQVFLYTVVNTVDPIFFPRAQYEIDSKRDAKKKPR